ncbi:glycosyltransferase family 39 protein [Actinocrinis puniceicyclus]|uniref:Glycosyltransferase family 39 protein n=1 Tax=Actinocrinis puniceicyclus TaxID=977794 RepID=A0A8J7WSM4_9ACTN|nr:glycosyltransferase family 39 protein [Actinocrinis puniceicyclus]MBS2964920.1 glycosyltransferase family 39 protein [Actinocrinis puniceicyclus]
MNDGAATPASGEQETPAAAGAKSDAEARDLLFELFRAHKALDRLTDPEPDEADYEVQYPAGPIRIPGRVEGAAAATQADIDAMAAAQARPDLLRTPDTPAAPDEPAARRETDRAAAAPAPPMPAPAPAPKRPGGNDSWRDSVPYEETGILIRPADWSTDRIETALINVGELREAERSADAPPAGRPRSGLLRFAPIPRRGILLVILFIQALLSLRSTNTAFEDEALYLYSGHLELAHLVNGRPIDDFASYFSGAPVLYPVAASVADQLGGVLGARLLSLAFMLGATCLAYLTGRRLFGVRSALCGAGLFATTASAVFIGGLATYDAPAVFLLALGAWIAVRSAPSSWPYYLLAVLPMLLAVATKYASLLFVPTIIVLACISALPYHGWRWALVRPVSLTVMAASMAYGALKLAGPSYVQGIQSTTTSRAQGGTPTETMLIEISKWGAPVFVAALIGALYYVFRFRPDADARLRLGTWGRAALSALLLGTALLAPMNQLRLHTDVSLQKHVGFGLLFAAPLAGYGLVRLVGSHFGRLQLGIGVAVTAFAFGMSQSHIMFRGWPDATRLVATIKQYQKPGAHYLVEVDEVPIYYLRSDVEAEPNQFVSTFYFLYQDAQGQYISGPGAYRAAVQQGYFQLVAIEDGTTTPQIDQAVLAALRAPGSRYRLAARIPERTAYGVITYQVWVKK